MQRHTGKDSSSTLSGSCGRAAPLRRWPYLRSSSRQQQPLMSTRKRGNKQPAWSAPRCFALTGVTTTARRESGARGAKIALPCAQNVASIQATHHDAAGRHDHSIQASTKLHLATSHGAQIASQQPLPKVLLLLLTVLHCFRVER